MAKPQPAVSSRPWPSHSPLYPVGHGQATARSQSMTATKFESSFHCSRDFLVAGQDYTIIEYEVSGEVVPAQAQQEKPMDASVLSHVPPFQVLISVVLVVMCYNYLCGSGSHAPPFQMLISVILRRKHISLTAGLKASSEVFNICCSSFRVFYPENCSNPFRTAATLAELQQPFQNCSNPCRTAATLAELQQPSQNCSNPCRTAATLAELQQPSQNCSNPRRTAATLAELQQPSQSKVGYP
ncbi:hypothetical protein RRG08_051896 [Elysia crispata]|uniref:Uncharacterized protein n=1 Tax=Elysia crispata TaxID=231223 RepID=A0AAE0Y2A9_9GAST|nr:hypothetical protein RRG08_051896 [Elysia crispata]